MDRLFNVEYAPLELEQDNALGWTMFPGSATDYRLLGTTTTAFVSEHKLDLSGYAMKDLTVYFRNSFEQRGGETFVIWNASVDRPLDVYDSAIAEVTILSSVPLTDNNLLATAQTSPGFIPAPVAGIDYGNFNRTHVVHGSRLLWQLDTSLSPNIADVGAAYNIVISSNDFSSLEPTAADCIYCYRVILCPNSSPAEPVTGLTRIRFPAKRVLLSATTDKEPDIEYLMRLKRSYELANQV